VKERVLLATFLESAGLSNLLLFEEKLIGVFLYGALHFGASLLISGALYPFVPRRYKRHGRLRVILLFAAFVGCTGPLGFVGSVFLYLFLLKRKRPEIPLERVSEEELLIPEVERRAFGEATAEKLNDKLVLFLMKSLNPVAFRYLRRAVSSEDDEVRLIAFSVLSNMEKEIFSKINSLLGELERAGEEEERFRILSTIAELYWELVFLNIADEELADFYLKTAMEYAGEALKIKKEGKLLFLMGRISLRRGKVDEAERYLREALRMGFPPEKVVPYLMEVFFRKREIEKVFEVAELVRGKLIPDIKASSIVKVWV